ncbi:hypothetical protein AVEN_167974-1 [Araneus ventricosus]|uniref:Uncharacterized protein n=1 Tax=Araneus ventricosus TaxID=182803 RepID=A0A4Y2WM94_ARAVE|nr:hypothetical protein AVEN_167974-1 [Araneus ventricosus]
MAMNGRNHKDNSCPDLAFGLLNDQAATTVTRELWPVTYWTSPSPAQTLPRRCVRNWNGGQPPINMPSGEVKTRLITRRLLIRVLLEPPPGQYVWAYRYLYIYTFNI